MEQSLLQEFARQVRQLSRQDKWLVGLSGGADSTALLRLCLSVQSPDKIFALHMNHCLRGDESNRDESFCRELCASCGVELIVHKLDVREFAAREKLNLEDAARHCRRDFFCRVALEKYPAAVLLAHHLGDHLETVLQRLMRGSGWRGLCGIAGLSYIIDHLSGKEIPLVRPLLAFSREEITGWLRSCGFLWREDSSNRNNEYFRNRLRHGVMPALHEAFPGLSERLHMLADYAAAQNQQLMRQATAIECRNQFGGYFFPLIQQLEMNVMSFIRRVEQCAQNLVGEIRFNSRSIQQLQLLLDVQSNLRAVDLPGGLRLRRETDGHFLFVTGAYSQPSETGRAISLEQPCCIDDGDWLFCTEILCLEGNVPDRDEKYIEYIPLDVVKGGLVLRRARTGERISIAGGSKKLSDIFTESGVPLRYRENSLVLSDEAGILWLPPLRVSSRITSGAGGFTGRFLRVEFHHK